MLQLRETRIVRSTHSPVLSSVLIPEEGMALVYVKEDGATKVALSTGVAGELFAGVSLSRNIHPGCLPYVQETVIPASGVVELVRAPIAGQLLVKVDGVQVTAVATAPASATETQLDGTTLTFAAGQAGKSVVAQFLYVPSVIEARSVIGDGPVGGLASTAEGVIGILKDAVFATNMFDASVDWSSALYAKTGPGGTFTVGTAADHIQNVVVQNAPNASNPFLALSITVA